MDDEIGFPIVERAAGEAAAMQAIRAHKVGGVAVPEDGRYVLVRAREILKSHDGHAPASDAGPGHMFTPGTGDARQVGSLLYIKARKLRVELFDVPAAYKQCTVNHNHVFDADFAGDKCPLNDQGDLVLKF